MAFQHEVDKFFSSKYINPVLFAPFGLLPNPIIGQFLSPISGLNT